MSTVAAAEAPILTTTATDTRTTTASRSVTEVASHRADDHAVAAVAAEAVELEIAALGAPLPLRDGTVVDDHVRRLAEVLDGLPPILVHRSTGRLIDGRHRIAAAALRGRTEISATLFEGSEADAHVVAVEVNIADGLDLTVPERVAAAERLVVSHAERSDRWIATVCGVSPRTVGNVRRRRAVDDASAAAQRRLGRDGRRRPLSADEGRRLAAEIMREEPGISLRRAAERAGISVGTVLDVRRRLEVGARPEAGAPMPDVAPLTRSGRTGDAASGSVVAGHRAVVGAPSRMGSREELRDRLGRLSRDPSLHTDAGRALLRLVATTLSFDEHAGDLTQVVPAYSQEVLADIAQTCAAAWMEFGDRLTGRDEPVERAG